MFKSIFSCYSYTCFFSFKFYTVHAWGVFTGCPLQSSWEKEIHNSCSKLNIALTFLTQTKAEIATDRLNKHNTPNTGEKLLTQTHKILYIVLPFTLLFPQVVHSFSVSVKRNAISFLPNASLSPCLTVFSSILLFSSNTFHKWQGERCPLKVIARLIKFPPPRKEQENVIKEKRRELERIDLPRRPSTPGPCPSISDEENGKKCKRILKKAEARWQVWHGDGNSSNTGVMRKRRDEREVRKAEWEDDN